MNNNLLIKIFRSIDSEADEDDIDFVIEKTVINTVQVSTDGKTQISKILTIIKKIKSYLLYKIILYKTCYFVKTNVSLILHLKAFLFFIIRLFCV